MIITRTPMRVSLFGGGTDIPKFYEQSPGAVFSMAINKYVYVAVNKKFSPGIRVSYSRTENVDSIGLIVNELVRESLSEVRDTLGAGDNHLEAVMMSDVPTKGSGLGASSALCVGLINAYAAHNHINLPPQRLAEMACNVELNRLRSPIGRQDQYACAHGGINHLTFTPDGVDVAPLSPKAYSFWRRAVFPWLRMYFVGYREVGANRILESAQRAPVDIRVMQEMVAQASAMSVILNEGNVDRVFEVGMMLRSGWELKKKLTPKACTRDIKIVIDKALEKGALGAKILGAGAGGFLLAFVPPDNGPEFDKAMGLPKFEFDVDYSGSTVIYRG